MPLPDLPPPEDLSLAELRDLAGALIAEVRRLQAENRALKDEVGLNHARYAILVMLAGQVDGGATTMTELAHIAGLSRSRLSHAIDSLEERGWVERTSCNSDKRTLSATLTPSAASGRR